MDMCAYTKTYMRVLDKARCVVLASSQGLCDKASVVLYIFYCTDLNNNEIKLGPSFLMRSHTGNRMQNGLSYWCTVTPLFFTKTHFCSDKTFVL